MKSHPMAHSLVAELERTSASGRAFGHGLRLSVGIRTSRPVGESHQICEGLLGIGRGVNDRGLVAAQDAELMADLAGAAVMAVFGEPRVRYTSAAAHLVSEFV